MRRLLVLATAGLALVGCGGGGGRSAPAVDPRTEAIADGAVALCGDGSYSDNADFSATCSSGDGVDEWLATYGECKDGTIFALSEDASCGKNGGFRALKPANYEPTSGKDDIAECDDGTFSDNTDFSATCSSHGGVERWLAKYGECGDGALIVMSATASCSSHDGFKGLKSKNFSPKASTSDIARCKDGSYSDNTKFSATCNSHGGINYWLATYGECKDGTVIEMSDEASCGSHGGFRALKPEGFVPPVTLAPPTTAPASTTTVPAKRKWSAGAPVTIDGAREAMQGDRKKAPNSLGRDERAEIVVNGGDIEVTYAYDGDKGAPVTWIASATAYTDSGALFKNKLVGNVTLHIRIPVIDRLGNKSKAIATSLRIDRSTYDAANWDGLLDRLTANATYMYCIAADQTIAPVLRDELVGMDCT